MFEIITPPEDPVEDIRITHQGDVVFGYVDPSNADVFIPHRYGGPARITAYGVRGFFEHGVWLWSEQVDQKELWWSWYKAPFRVQMYESFYVVKTSPDAPSGTRFKTHATGWPLSVPRRQKTPPHPEGLVDDRAYERSPES